MTTMPASHYRDGRLGDVDLAVIHTSETSGSRFQLARSMANSSRPASYHSIVDATGRLDVVDFSDTAYAAPGANADGDQLCIVGYARWPRTVWLGEHRALVEQAARWTAQRCRLRRLPVQLLTPEQLRADARGVTSHAAVSAAFHRSTHTDPGRGFPFDVMLKRVKTLLTPPGTTADARPVATRQAPPWPLEAGQVLPRGVWSQATLTWQRQMRRRGWNIRVDGVYGRQAEAVAEAFQRQKRLRPVDGRVGPVTWRAAWTAAVT